MWYTIYNMQENIHIHKNNFKSIRRGQRAIVHLLLTTDRSYVAKQQETTKFIRNLEKFGTQEMKPCNLLKADSLTVA